MLSPPDQGHFFKYLTTLGVAIVVASLGIGGTLLQVQSDLLIEKAKLAQITETAQRAIQRKQEVVLFVTQWTPVAVAVLATLGIALSVVGLIGWKSRQNTLDKKDRAELSKLLTEIEVMTEEQKEEKAQREAVESVLVEPEEVLIDESEKAERCVTLSIDENLGAKSVSNLEIGEIREVKNRFMAAEEELGKKLSLAFASSSVQGAVRARMPGLPRVEADGLVADTFKKRLYVFELKVLSSSFRLGIVGQAVEQLSLASESFVNWYPGYRVVPVLIFVVDGVGVQLHRRKEKIRDSFKRLGSKAVLLVYSVEDFSNLPPERLRSDIGRARALEI